MFALCAVCSCRNRAHLAAPSQEQSSDAARVCTGSVRDGSLWRKKSYVLSLRLLKMSSVFKSWSFQSKKHTSSPFVHAPPPSLLYPYSVPDVSLKHCTLFLRMRMAHKCLAGMVRETCSLQEPSRFCAPKASSCKWPWVLLSEKTFFWGAGGHVKTIRSQSFSFKPCSVFSCGLFYRAWKFLLWQCLPTQTK